VFKLVLFYNNNETTLSFLLALIFWFMWLLCERKPVLHPKETHLSHLVTT